MGLPLQVFSKNLEESGVEEITEPKDVFSRILKVNQGSTKLLREGDIALKPGHSAQKCDDCKWDKSSTGNVIVPYIMSSGYKDTEVSLINASMQEFETLTCVRFVPYTTEKNAINITSAEDECWSGIGRKGGIQHVSLGGGCMYKGIIQHEINHALGFVHEHSRSDRDDYVTIMYQYISPGDRNNFNPYDSNNMGLEYDYESVMHYARDTFSNTSGKDTIVPKPDPSVQIGQGYGLSSLDISKINKLYQCDICSSLLPHPSGTVTSANYPSAYPNNDNCVWLIRTPYDQVSLKFEAFDVQFSTNCVSDYIKIYDGASKTSPVLLDRTCGSGEIPQLISSTNLMLIEFVSDGTVTATGFKAIYNTERCGGTFYTPSRTFTSPGYPITYYDNLDCFFNITAPAGYKIVLNISDFFVENAANCRFDYLSIFDGDNPDSPLLFHSCGENEVPIQVSTGNSMLLYLHSDGDKQEKGFKASYTINSWRAYKTEELEKDGFEHFKVNHRYLDLFRRLKVELGGKSITLKTGNQVHL
ncbi:embryonic protein UVS.2-like [Ascaphus truei]|uniref:embryonic protein UVS.2-like n=1 Tax=Ascaphus truei TaxID=8439 RepID=UPI003F5A0A0A